MAVTRISIKDMPLLVKSYKNQANGENKPIKIMMYQDMNQMFNLDEAHLFGAVVEHPDDISFITVNTSYSIGEIERMNTRWIVEHNK